MHCPAQRAVKALPALVVAAGLALAADPPGRAASTGEGATEKQIFTEKLPNVPGKTLTVVQVDYRPGGFSAPHRHPASGCMSSRVLSAPRSRASPSASTALARAGPSRPTPTTSSAPMRARPSRRG